MLPNRDSRNQAREQAKCSYKLLDLDQGASRGLELTEGTVGSMLGEAGVEPSFWEQMSEHSDSAGMACMTHGNPVVNTSMTADDREEEKLAQVHK